MKHLSAVEIAFMVSEIAKIGNAKLQQLYQPARKELILQFHVRSRGRAVLKVRVPEGAYIATDKEAPEKVSGFCSLLRKKLNNSILKAVSQPGFERIITLEFYAKNEHLSLIFELFSKGNIILARNGKILAAAEKQHWSTREVATGQKYSLPPAITNPNVLDEKQLLGLLKNTNKTDLVRFLAMELSLGGLYAEELCLLSGINKKTNPSAVTAATAKKLLQSLKALLKSKPSPSVIYENGRVLDAVPIALAFYKSRESKPAKTFSEALEAYYSSAVVAESPYDRELHRLNVILDSQRDTVAALRNEVADNSRRGELIYEHYQDIKRLLEIVNHTRKDGGWDAVRQLQKQNKKIKSIDEKSGKIVLDL